MAVNDNQFVTASVCTWPEPWQTWAGGEYPARRSALPPLRGWICSGCGRGYSPSMMVCSQCGRPEETVTAAGANGTSQRLGPDDPITDDDWER